jgi:hypothetical protein
MVRVLTDRFKDSFSSLNNVERIKTKLSRLLRELIITIISISNK